MKNLLKNRKIISGVVIVVIAFFLYNFLSDSEEAVTPTDGLGLKTATEANDDLLKMATELSQVNYETGLFSTPGYILLTDFSLPLVPQSVGRSNPFNITGRD